MGEGAAIVHRPACESSRTLRGARALGAYLKTRVAAQHSHCRGENGIPLVAAFMAVVHLICLSRTTVGFQGALSAPLALGVVG